MGKLKIQNENNKFTFIEKYAVQKYLSYRQYRVVMQPLVKEIFRSYFVYILPCILPDSGRRWYSFFFVVDLQSKVSHFFVKKSLWIIAARTYQLTKGK